MRRVDREITDKEEMIRVMNACDVCRLALHDGDFPYILPLNFAMEVKDGQIAFYFHGAKEGHKYELIARDNRASFEMDCGHELILDEEKGMCSMAYESVIGRGRISEITEYEEKIRALRLLMKQYGREDFPFLEESVAHTRILKLDVETFTGKRRKMPKK